MVTPANTQAVLACYLCGSRALKTLATELRHGPGLAAYCDACGLGRLEPSAEDLKKFYDETYRKQYTPAVNTASSYAEIFDSYVGYQGRRLDLLRPRLRPDMRVLDVGCSTGHFLYNVKPLVREVVGVDYDSGAAAYAAQRGGFRTFGGALDDAGLAPASFDVITAMQTMEHVEDPVAFAQMLGRYLKPDGQLYIEVPNLDDALLSVYGNAGYRKFYFRNAHLFYFTARSLAAVMQRAGFTADVGFLQDYNVLNHWHWQAHGRPQASCLDGLGPARMPAVEHAPAALRDALAAWIASADASYRAMLAAHGATDNLACFSRKTTG